MNMHPFLKYPGGKAKELPLILNCLPIKINNYIEPFVGGGSVYFAMNCNKSFINDKSTDLMNLYKFIKEDNRKFIQITTLINDLWKEIEYKDFNDIDFKFLSSYKDVLLKYYSNYYSRKINSIVKLENNGNKIGEANKVDIFLTAKKASFYNLIRYVYNNEKDNIELRTATFYFLREYCYSSMFRFSKNGNFNVPYGGMSYNKKYLDEKIKYITSNDLNSFMKDTKIFNLDFEDFFKKIEIHNDDFIFLDPPYDTSFSSYDNNSFDKNEQIRLKECISKIKCNWLLVIKKTDFIYDLYKDFNIYEYDMNYSVSFKNRNNKEVKHLLITNYPLNTYKYFSVKTKNTRTIR